MATPDEQQSTAPEQSADASARRKRPPRGVSRRKKLAAAENEIAALKEQLKDQQLRNLAEMENLRKRNAQESPTPATLPPRISPSRCWR